MKRAIPTPLRMLAPMVAFLATAGVSWAGPTVVPTAEGQIGETPGALDRQFGTRFESIRGGPKDAIFSTIFQAVTPMPPPPEFSFLTDEIHGYPDPVPIDAVPTPFANIEKVPAASAWSRNANDDGDFVAFSFAVDGAMPQTMTVRIATFDETGASVVGVPVAQNITTFPIIDPSAAETGVAVDDQGRVTVAYTELVNGTTSTVRATRFDPAGNPLNLPFDVSGPGHASVDIALLDPAGNRLIVPYSSFNGIRGTIVDLSSGTPVVQPNFPVNTTPAAFAMLNPSVAAHPGTGTFTVVWEDITGAQFNPGDIRGRRFDAGGNPIGNDFVVNTTTANNQAQPHISIDTDSALAAVVWAGDSGVQGDELDVFLQVYDADGNPIGGEVRANTTTAGIQDKPSVRFLPERDDQGRPQVTVVWRDVANANGSMANGTGTSYKCFSINGFDEQVPIFADGFESGDTSSWSETVSGGSVPPSPVRGTPPTVDRSMETGS